MTRLSHLNQEQRGALAAATASQLNLCEGLRLGAL
jgi:hypothetical protein